MSKVVVLGAGVAGHTAASFLREWLDKSHEVTVVSALPTYNWIPSNISLGLSRMNFEWDGHERHQYQCACNAANALHAFHENLFAGWEVCRENCLL